MLVTTVASSQSVSAPFLDELRDTIGHDKYDLWFKDVAFDAVDQTLQVFTPSRFIADWIASHFREPILHVAQQHLDPDTQVMFSARPTGERGSIPAVAPLATRVSPHAAPAVVIPSSTRSARMPVPRHRPQPFRYSLDDFIVGPSNELAFNSAARMVDDPASPIRILFVHSGCGMGKTHLLQGLCRKYTQQADHYRVRYTTAEQFTNQYITAIRSNRLEAFRRSIRRLDLLAVDDVHFFANKAATQAEFLHTFDAIDLKGARIILASDAHPKQIEQFSEALVSRFVSGMVVRIAPPDVDMRARLITSLARKREMNLLQPAISALAERSASSSIREIEGMLTRLNALALLDSDSRKPDQPIGLNLLNRLAEHQSPVSPRPVRFDHILECVCEHMQVDRAAILSSSRHRHIVLARSLAIHLARRLTTLSFPELAKLLKRPNHSTIITAAQRIQAQAEKRQTVRLIPNLITISLDQLIEQLLRRITDRAQLAA